jgi:hypothetical protein
VHALSDVDIGEADGLRELFDRPFAFRWLISAARSYTPRTAPRVPMGSADGRVKVRETPGRRRWLHARSANASRL